MNGWEKVQQMAEEARHIHYKWCPNCKRICTMVLRPGDYLVCDSCHKGWTEHDLASRSTMGEIDYSELGKGRL